MLLARTMRETHSRAAVSADPVSSVTPLTEIIQTNGFP
jgi:hypothetical protein